jgi:protein tyrosine/serine phosphatase
MSKYPLVAPAIHLSPLQRIGAWFSALFVDHAVFRFFYNTRTRVTDDLYRSSHPLPYQLKDAKAAGIRSVISLRGDETHVGSNRLEWDVCADLGLKLVHYPIGSRDAPAREQVLAINQLFSTLERPILVHCKSGADRAGLASTLFLLMQEKRPLEEAIRQMSFWRFGHVKQAKTGILDHFFEVYREHRDRYGTSFEDWLLHHYDRKAVRKSFHSNWWANQLVDRVLGRE